jgi:PAS domain S-box-containing protein
MSQNRIKAILLLTIPLIAVGGFLMDLATPLGVSHWVWYFIPLLLSVYAPTRFFPYLLTGVFSLMILVGFYLSPPDGNPYAGLTGRLVGLGVFWAIALLLSQHKEVEQVLVRTKRALKTLTNCNQALARANDESTLLQEICEVIVKEGGFRLAWVGFAENDEQKSVRIGGHAGYDEGYLEKANISWADNERGRGPTGVAIRTGNIQVCNDFQTDPKVAPWRAEARKRGFASSIVLPLRNNNQNFGVLTIYAAQADAFPPDEVAMLAELADDVAFGIQSLRSRVEHQRAEMALRSSEAKYRQLFEGMLDGFALHEIVCDAAGRPVDYRFLSVNPAFERLTGLRAANVVGRTVLEIMPETEPSWIERYGRVALTGAGIQFDDYSKILQRHFEVAAFCPQPGQFAAIFIDITERKQTEEANARLATAVEQAADSIVITDAAGRILYANPAFEKSSGAGPESSHPQKRPAGYGILPADVGATRLRRSVERPFFQPAQGRHALPGKRHHLAHPGRQRQNRQLCGGQGGHHRHVARRGKNPRAG